MRHNILVRRLFLAGMIAWSGLAVPAAADRAWTRDQVSPGLQAVNRSVAVVYQPGNKAAPIPDGARITRVYASRNYDSSARVATDLCWGSAQGPCVPLQSSHLNTRAFEGRSAQAPLLLRHRVLHWGNDSPPLFVRGTVTVWYAVEHP